jgi:hypothetical protein
MNLNAVTSEELWGVYYAYLDCFTNSTPIVAPETTKEKLISVLEQCRTNVLQKASGWDQSGLDGPKYMHRPNINRILHAYIGMIHDKLLYKLKHTV